MLFSANFFTNEVTNAKAVIKFGTEANKKIQPKVVAHVSFAQQKSAFAGFKAHREALIAAGFGVDGKLPNGIRKAIDRVKPAKDVAVDHIVTFTVKNSSELFHLVIAGDTAIVSAPNMDFQDTADCQITFGRRKEVTGKAKLNFTKSGNPYFAVFFNSHATEKEVVELVAYEGEEKERIESCEAFLELEAQVNAVSPVVEFTQWFFNLIAGVTRHDTAPPMKPEFQMVAAIRYIDALRFEPTSELALFHIASLPLSISTK